MSALANAEFEEMAADELKRAQSLSWREASKITPWGDVYEGFAPSGQAVQVERNYLWAAEPGGDVLCEVAVYSNPVLYDHGAKISAVIAKPR
jgi:hypothetical protein